MSAYTNAYETREGSEIVTYPGFAVEFRSQSHRYWGHVDGERKPWVSVTSALKVIDKPALVSWAERIGVEGALQLERDGKLDGIAIWDAHGVVRGMGAGADAKREAGADRGTAIHDALQAYCSEGTVPNVADFDLEVRGYVSALCGWLLAASPEPLLVEQIVGSAEYGYAGRVDLVADVEGQRTLCDLKTSPTGRIFTEAHLQTAAYGLALEECGLDPVQRTVIVGCGADGEFAQADCCADPQQFLDVLKCHRAVAAVRGSVRAQEKRVEATA